MIKIGCRLYVYVLTKATAHHSHMLIQTMETSEKGKRAQEHPRERTVWVLRVVVRWTTQVTSQ